MKNNTVCSRCGDLLEVETQQEKGQIKEKEKANENIDKNHHNFWNKEASICNLLEEMINNIKSLPSHAMQAPVTHYDFYCLLSALSSFFKPD